MSAHPDTPVFFAVPDVIDDPSRVSGGNLYDQRVRDGLRADGWDVRMTLVVDDDRQTARALTALPDDALVLLDGLLLAREPAVVADHGARLRLVVLAHMVAAELTDDERAAFRVAQRIIATSGWTRSELIAQDAADPHRIVVAHPGTDAAPVTRVSASGGRLLCVATVAPHKGQDLLVRALAGFADLEGWTCTIVGSLDAAPDFVTELVDAIASAGLAERIMFTGVLTGPALDAAYGRADLVILPSRTESYGMAVAEALAHGIPVLASGVGGIPEAIARSEAGMIVSPDDPWALAVVLRQWWASADRRRELTAAAVEARSTARRWSDTTAIVAAALEAAVTAPAAGDVAARS